MLAYMDCTIVCDNVLWAVHKSKWLQGYLVAEGSGLEWSKQATGKSMNLSNKERNKKTTILKSSASNEGLGWLHVPI